MQSSPWRIPISSLLFNDSITNHFKYPKDGQTMADTIEMIGLLPKRLMPSVCAQISRVQNPIQNQMARDEHGQS